MNWKENKKKVIAAVVALLVLIIIIILLVWSCGDKGTKETTKNPVGTEQSKDNGKTDDETLPGDDNTEGGLQVVDPDDEQAIKDSSTDISEFFDDVVETEKVEPECKDEKHNVKHVKKVAATTKKAGNIEYWYCKDCKKYFADAACTELITGGKKATVIAKKTEAAQEEEPTKDPEIEIEEVEQPDDCVSKKHTVKHVERVDATKETEGNIEYWYCEECDKYYKDKDCTQLIVNGKEATVIPKLPENLQEDTPGWGRFY